MKKFLIFLVAIVVVVTLGVTTYYFMRSDEVINFSTLEIYCNVGDTLYLNKDLGYSVTKQSSKTTYNYNAGGSDVTSVISYSESDGYYTANKGGTVELVITTSNNDYPKFTIQVHVGAGTSENPYYITKYAQLAMIGNSTSYTLGGCYKLMNDITLSSSFVPIGYTENEGTYSLSAFTGEFDGNGYTIYGLNLDNSSNSSISYAGLFAKVSGASVHDLTISKAKITGSYDYAGALAGYAAGSTITRVQVKDATISNSADAGVTGGLVGIVTTSSSSVTLSYATGSITTSSTGSAYVIGGLAGTISEASVNATYADVSITAGGSSTSLGGFAGKFVIGTTTGSIQQSYSVSTSSNSSFASFIGVIDSSSVNTSDYNVLSYLVGNYSIGTGNVVNTYSDSVFTSEIITSTTDWTKSNQGYYLISQCSSRDAFAETTPIFYKTSGTASATGWSQVAWSNLSTDGTLPTLNMTTNAIASVSSAYLNRNLADVTVSQTTDLTSEVTGTAGTYAFNAKEYTLSSDLTLTCGTDYTPRALIGATFDGAGYTITIKNLTPTTYDNETYLGLFTLVENSAIKNLNIVIESFASSTSATYAGGLAGKIISSNNSTSEITNVTVTYQSVTLYGTYTYAGGLAGYVEGATLGGTSVTGYNTNCTTTYIGGLVGYLKSSSVDSATYSYGDTPTTGTATVSVSSTISTTSITSGAEALYIGGVAGYNYSSSIINAGVTSTITTASLTDDLSQYVGGVAGYSNGSIKSCSITPTITVNGSNVYVGGVTGNNAGTISTVTLASGGYIQVGGSTGTVTLTGVKVGGVSAVNSNVIEKAYVYLSSLGFSSSEKITVSEASVSVGGLVVTNSGSISKSIAGSNIYGTTVAGAVVEMTEYASASVDQVLIADYENGGISASTIKGYANAAGIVYNFATGTITNIQAVNVVAGYVTTSNLSLMTLLFPTGVTLNYATINSYFDGYGVRYLESQFAYGGGSNDYNIYGASGVAGVMKNVVINEDTINDNGTKGYDYSATFIITGTVYTTCSYNGESFHLLVTSSEFTSTGTYTGEKSISTGSKYGVIIGFIGGSSSYTVTMSLDSSAWSQPVSTINYEYYLTFLASV